MGLFIQIDIAAVLVSAIVGFIIGALWYSPMLFGDRWMKLMKISKKEIEKSQKEGMAGTMFSAFIAVIITALVLNVLVVSMLVSTPYFAAKLGLLLWVGLIAPTFLNGVLWEKLPMELYLIRSSHYLVALVVMCVIISLMVF